MRASVIAATITVLVMFTGSRHVLRGQALAPPSQCAPQGAQIDSAFAVRKAAEKLEAQDSLGPYKVTKFTALDEGYVVSLVVVREPPPVGGGGLVWVDTETGCAIVLRLYE